jgi:hypothetical protein
MKIDNLQACSGNGVLCGMVDSGLICSNLVCCSHKHSDAKYWIICVFVGVKVHIPF